jgi:hypothetical protein
VGAGNHRQEVALAARFMKVMTQRNSDLSKKMKSRNAEVK